MNQTERLCGDRYPGKRWTLHTGWYCLVWLLFFALPANLALGQALKSPKPAQPTIEIAQAAGGSLSYARIDGDGRVILIFSAADGSIVPAQGQDSEGNVVRNTGYDRSM